MNLDRIGASHRTAPFPYPFKATFRVLHTSEHWALSSHISQQWLWVLQVCVWSQMNGRLHIHRQHYASVKLGKHNAPAYRANAGLVGFRVVVGFCFGVLCPVRSRWWRFCVFNSQLCYSVYCSCLFIHHLLKFHWILCYCNSQIKATERSSHNYRCTHNYRCSWGSTHPIFYNNPITQQLYNFTTSQLYHSWLELQLGKKCVWSK